jgi:hypothetical protein
MEITAENEVESPTQQLNHKRGGSGIKNFTFTASGTNGTSHRRNRVKKAQQYRKNQDARRELNQQRARMSAGEYHLRLTAISTGNS